MEGESLTTQPSHADKIRAGLLRWRGHIIGLTQEELTSFCRRCAIGIPSAHCARRPTTPRRGSMATAPSRLATSRSARLVM